MYRVVSLRIAAALVLALCLAGGGRAGVGGNADQGFGYPPQRHHAASASATRVPQARSGHTQGAPDLGLQAGNPVALTALIACYRVPSPGVATLHSNPVDCRSGRSPPLIG